MNIATNWQISLSHLCDMGKGTDSEITRARKPRCTPKKSIELPLSCLFISYKSTITKESYPNKLFIIATISWKGEKKQKKKKMRSFLHFPKGKTFIKEEKIIIKFVTSKYNWINKYPFTKKKPKKQLLKKNKKTKGKSHTHTLKNTQ